jgi:hypothetical protein
MSDIIRKLIQETEALPKAELPGAWEWAKNHPGILSYRTKEQERYDQDLRRAYFLEQMDKRAPEARTGEMLRAGSVDAVRALRSPYEPYGDLGPASNDGPLANTMRWWGSVPGAVYATGQMLANKVDPEGMPYPNAPDDFAKNINNFVAIAEPLGKNKNHMRDMQAMREAQARLPWSAGLGPGQMPREDADQLIAAIGSRQADPKGGKQFLEDAGYGGNTAMIGGALLDAFVDPLFIPGKRIAGLAADVGLGSLHGTAPIAIESVRKLNEMRPAWGAY